MEYLSKALIVLVALEHVYILVLEMFFWTHKRTLRIFGQSLTFAKSTKAMAANQGLYNGFLAGGLFWGLLHPKGDFGFQIQSFFLCCVIIAAVYGAFTVKRSIIVIQGVPAILALLCLLFVG